MRSFVRSAVLGFLCLFPALDGAQWSKLRASASDHIDEIRAKIDQQRDDHDANVASRRADQAEQNAADSIDFATWAVAEAEASVLEAADARMIADSLV